MPPPIPSVCRPLSERDPRNTQAQRAPVWCWEHIAPDLVGGGPVSWLSLLIPSSALVLAFRGAHRKQEEQRRKLEQQVALMEVRQAEELEVLEATVRALGRPRPSCPPPRLGETFL